MLLWEIDQPLRQLSEVYGFERAARAYRASLDAVAGLKSLVGQLGIACDMREKNSLYLAAGDSSAGSARRASVARARRAARRFSRPWHAARPFRLRACRGDRLRRVRPMPIPCNWRMGCSGWRLRAARGCSRARPWHSMPPGVRWVFARKRSARSRRGPSFSPPAMSCPISFSSTVHAVSSSWAIATVPQPQNIWNDGALIWEDAKDYLYARTTRAGRIIIGGEDSTEIVEPEARDRLIPQKSRALRRRLAALWPAARTDIEFRWSGTFDTTQRRIAADRPGPRRQGRLCGLRLWRQRHHLQFSCRASDRRPDRRKNFAIAGRFRHRSRWRQDRLKHGWLPKNGYGNGPPWARDVGLPNEVY